MFYSVSGHWLAAVLSPACRDDPTPGLVAAQAEAYTHVLFYIF